MTGLDLKDQLTAELGDWSGQTAPPVSSLQRRVQRRRTRRLGLTAGLLVTGSMSGLVVADLGHHSGVSKVEVGEAPSTSATVAPRRDGPFYVNVPNPATATCQSVLYPYPTLGVRQLVTVDPDPSGVTAFWVPPALNAGPCKVQITTGGSDLARQLADDIDRLPAMPAMSCPAAVGGSISLYFTYPGQHKAELVQKDLTGCREITAPGGLALIDGCIGGSAATTTSTTICDVPLLDPILKTIAPSSLQRWL